LEGVGGGTRKAQIFNFIPNAKIVKEPKMYPTKQFFFLKNLISKKNTFMFAS